MKSVAAVVSGKVQGVCFRQFTCDQAIRLGVNGYVRNLANGDVEIMAEGAPERVEALIDLCRKGPRSARVDSLTLIERKDGAGFQEFKILY